MRLFRRRSSDPAPRLVSLSPLRVDQHLGDTYTTTSSTYTSTYGGTLTRTTRPPAPTPQTQVRWLRLTSLTPSFLSIITLVMVEKTWVASFVAQKVFKNYSFSRLWGIRHG